MPSYAELVKDNLMAVIKSLEQRKDQFVKHPGKDLTRKRKLSFRERNRICVNSNLITFFFVCIAGILGNNNHINNVSGGTVLSIVS